MPTYPLTPPSSPGLTRISWQSSSVVAVQRSPFTLQQKVYAWDGQQRMFTAEFPPMTLEQAKPWHAFILSLNGAEGTFYWRDSIAKASHGTAAGNVLVKGANQTGNSLILDGLLPNHVLAFAAGDYLSIGDRLYTVLEDAASDAAGEATLSIWPSIRTAYADNTAVLLGSAARGIFRLTQTPEMNWPLSRLMEGFKLSAEEAI